MTSRKHSALKLFGLALASALLMGCPKPPPPPPPPTAPPPPPPPAEVALETIAQDLKADARVQVKSGLTVVEDNVDFGRAMVKLADAIAKGDASVLRPMLTRRAQNVLGELESSGGWSEGTGKIESVRIVYFGEGVDIGGVGSGAMGTPELTQALMAKSQELFSSLSPEQVAAMGKAMGEVMASVDPSVIQSDPAAFGEQIKTQLADAATSAGLGDDFTAKLDQLTSLAAGASGDTSTGSATGVLLAIQDPKGSYLLGWAAEKAGDQWVFTNAPATGDIRATAAAWDGVGSEGFRMMNIATAPVPVAPPPASDKDADSGSSNETPSDSGGGASPGSGKRPSGG